MADDMNARTSSVATNVATKRPSDGATSKKRKHNFTHALYTGEISYGFIQRRKIWYTITAAVIIISFIGLLIRCLLYTSPSPRDQRGSRMPSSA